MLLNKYKNKYIKQKNILDDYNKKIEYYSQIINNNKIIINKESQLYNELVLLIDNYEKRLLKTIIYKIIVNKETNKD